MISGETLPPEIAQELTFSAKLAREQALKSAQLALDSATRLPEFFETGSVNLKSEPTYSVVPFGLTGTNAVNHVISYQVIQTDLILGTSYPPRFDLHEWIISIWNRIWNRICRVVYEWYHREEVNLIEEELAAQKALAAVDPEFARSIQ